MKRVVYIILVLSLILSLAACQQGTEVQTADNQQENNQNIEAGEEDNQENQENSEEDIQENQQENDESSINTEEESTSQFFDETKLKEIELKEEFVKAASEEADILERTILRVISKWHYELHQSRMTLMPILLRANMMDGVTHEIINDLNISSLNNNRDLEKIRSWMKKELAHTQNLPDFENEPGRDPWGRTSKEPIWKKLLPSEMKAMSMYSGKITGKCGTLANLNYGLFRLLGIDSNNIVNLRIDGHTFGLAKVNGRFIILNNNKLQFLDKNRKEWLFLHEYYGFYNDAFSVYRKVTINDEVLNYEGNLVEALCTVNNIKIKNEDTDFFENGKDQDSIKSHVFSNSESKSSILTKYAYQSLYVKRPEMYLKASIRAPKAFELANKLETDKDIIDWIKTNISYGSIFEDYKERIMLSDQVIVFKKGGVKDQAVLAYTLLKLKGYEPQIKMTMDNIYIEFDSKIYNVENWEEIDSITDEIEFIWRISS